MKKLFGFSLIASLFVLASCAKAPYQIGFVGSLSIKQSQLSLDARNAVELVIEQVNAEGGINGHKIELVVKDDENDHEKAMGVYDEFRNEGIELVFGHMTSSMAGAMLDGNGDDLLFISPSVSAHSVANLDDYIIRTAPTLDGQAKEFIQDAKKQGHKNVLVIYDLMNQAYAENLALIIKDGETEDFKVSLLSFDSRISNNIEQLKELESYDAVMFLSQAIDTGYFAQQVRQTGSDISMYSVSWSMTKDLITNGGQAVEGMRMIGIFQPQTPSESQLKFEEDFENRYSYKPSFIAHFSYDTIHMLIDAIEDADSDDAKEVKTSLLNGELYEGIYENLKFNEYGDSNRRYLIHKIVDGEFVPQY